MGKRKKQLMVKGEMIKSEGVAVTTDVILKGGLHGGIWFTELASRGKHKNGGAKTFHGLAGSGGEQGEVGVGGGNEKSGQ